MHSLQRLISGAFQVLYHLMQIRGVAALCLTRSHFLYKLIVDRFSATRKQGSCSPGRNARSTQALVLCEENLTDALYLRPLWRRVAPSLSRDKVEETTKTPHRLCFLFALPASLSVVLLQDAVLNHNGETFIQCDLLCPYFTGVARGDRLPMVGRAINRKAELRKGAASII